MNHLGLAGALVYRGLASFYFGMSTEQALYFNGIDMGVSIIARFIFEDYFKLNEAVSIITAHAISAAIGFAVTTHLYGAFDPLAVAALTIGSIFIRTLLPAVLAKAT